jgi:hypothetical protein
MPEDIVKGQVVTPEKKAVLLDQIKSEINNVSSQIKEGKYGDAAIKVLDQNQKSLQKLLNNLLLKKGVVTPSETDNALNLINTSKKNRLQDDYIIGIKKSTIILFSLIALGGAFYWYKYKRGNK